MERLLELEAMVVVVAVRERGDRMQHLVTPRWGGILRHEGVTTNQPSLHGSPLSRQRDR